MKEVYKPLKDDNVRHARRTGLHITKFGEESGRAILKHKDVEYIRDVHISRHPEFGLAGLGRTFGVTSGCIWQIVHHKNWLTN